LTTEQEFEKRLNAVEEKQEIEFANKEKSIKVLVEQKESMAEQMGLFITEIENLKSAAQASQGLRDMIRREVEDWASIKGVEKASSGGSKLDLTHGELQVSINHKDPEPIRLDTKTGRGQIMYILIEDLKGEASSQAQLIEKMREHPGWRVNPGTISANMADLVKKGLLVRENGTYRPPKFLKVS